MSDNNSAFTYGNPKAPRHQVAFIQDNASISQTVVLDAGIYNLSMFAAQRINYQTQAEEIQVGSITTRPTRKRRHDRSQQADRRQ